MGSALVSSYVSFGQYKSPDRIIRDIHKTTKITTISAIIIADLLRFLGKLINNSFGIIADDIAAGLISGIALVILL